MSSSQELSHNAGEATGQVQVHTKTQKDNVEEYCINITFLSSWFVLLGDVYFLVLPFVFLVWQFPNLGG